ncbi:MAG: acetoacetyl-CoA reductase [Betaproteobacteria bacterium]|nr:acetoacetyl-CoA reductase [Betaproteobacteria bacterium]
MNRLNGKTALVTGGVGGIGSAICKKLADAGCKVVANYIDEAHAQEWKAKMAAEGYDFAIVKCDVSSFDDCKAMGEKLNAEFGGVDIVVNNAGITKDGTFRKMSPDQWGAVLNVNLMSVFNVTKQFVDGMMNKGWGRVINISSINGQKGQFGQTNYAAAKAGMHGFTMSLAQETAKKGVTVNSISPGYIGTEMVMAIAEDVRNQIVAQIPIGRLGKPEEIAALVAFLASEDAAFITGANIAANGGQHMM